MVCPKLTMSATCARASKSWTAVDAVSVEELVYDGTSRTEWFTIDENRVACLCRAEAVMIDDFHHLRLLESLHALLGLIVVHHDQLGFRLAQKTTACDKPCVGLSIKNRKAAEFTLGQDVPGFFEQGVGLKAWGILDH
jgi:hypothetical protein